MKLGTENKKQVVALCLLGLVAAYFLYTNVIAGGSPAPTRPTSRTDNIAAAVDATLPPTAAATPGPDISRGKKAPARRGSRVSEKEFNPPFVPLKKEEQIDLTKVDPTVRLDLLAKAQAVPPAGGERDLFTILRTPPVKVAAVLPGKETKVYPIYGPTAPPPPAPPQPPAPPPPDPPIPLKYYGLADEHHGKKYAYFLDGEDIVQAGEGDILLKGRYKVMKIEANSAKMQDIQTKKEKNLPLEPEGGTGG